MDSASLAFTGVARQAELVRAGEVSPRELVELYLERIERLDPQLNAFRSVYRERALIEADQAAARLRGGEERVLLGVPVAIKDNTDVAGDVTTHGTNAYGEPASEDAEVVRRVRAAGAIVLGKTHVPPLCALPCTESPTWGITRNPWNLDRTPGGSSGGSGAAVAAGLVGAALGTDGAGSIRFPAAHNGLFGLKPQRGRLSLAPLADHWHGMTVAGWLTRGVGDAALLYDATMGNVERDRDRPPPPARPFSAAAAAAPERLRIAYSLRPMPGTVGAGPDSDSRRALMDTVDVLRSLGHDVHERDPDIPFEATSHGLLRTLRGVADEARTLPHLERLDLRFRRLTRAAGLIPDGAVARARAGESAVVARVGRLFEDHEVLVAPVAPQPAFEVGRWEGRGMVWTLNGSARQISFTALWNQTGQPVAAVPAGWTADGIPLSVQLVGRANDEDTLLSLAAQLEAERPWADRRPPVS
jgi:amidase